MWRRVSMRETRKTPCHKPRRCGRPFDQWDHLEVTQVQWRGKERTVTIVYNAKVSSNDEGRLDTDTGVGRVISAPHRNTKEQRKKSERQRARAALQRGLRKEQARRKAHETTSLALDEEKGQSRQKERSGKTGAASRGASDLQQRVRSCLAVRRFLRQKVSTIQWWLNRKSKTDTEQAGVSVAALDDREALYCVVESWISTPLLGATVVDVPRGMPECVDADGDRADEFYVCHGDGALARLERIAITPDFVCSNSQESDAQRSDADNAGMSATELQQKKQEHASADIAAAAAPCAEALAGIGAVADDLADEGTVPVGDDSVDAHLSDQNEIVKGGKYWYWDRKDGQEKQVFCVVLPPVCELTQGRIPLSKCANHATGGSGLDRPRLGPALVWNSS